jgi:hypothetical protein
VTIPGIPEAIGATGAAAGLMAGMLSVWLHRRTVAAWRREAAVWRREVEELRAACFAETARVGKELEAWKRESQAAADAVCDGRLSASTRSRAMRMLRAGVTPAAAAAELGIARSEARLLKEVAAALTGRE